MVEQTMQVIMAHGDKAKFIPISRLEDIRKYIAVLNDSGLLNNFQKFIINNLYKTDMPEAALEAKSILIVASPGPSSAKLYFRWKGKRVPLFIPASYIEKNAAPERIEQYLNAFLSRSGYRVAHAPGLPHKLLAVRSGLGLYGRNNICYVEGMGSFLNLSLFFSNIPCADENWHEIRQMDCCKSCTLCLDHCPTRAITADRFLIDNERCLTYFNEGGGEWDFPEWISPSAHNCIYGCLKCQAVCPKDKAYLDNVIEPAEFSEEETSSLIEGKPYEQFTCELKRKIEDLNMVEYLGALPRNLKVLFNSHRNEQ